jgi:hypothetical protein
MESEINQIKSNHLLQLLDREKKINAVSNLVSEFLLLGLFQGMCVLRDQSLTVFMSMSHRHVLAIMPSAVSNPAECILSLPHF